MHRCSIDLKNLTSTHVYNRLVGFRISLYDY